MKIDIRDYIINDIGNTSWWGETNHDNNSLDNMNKIDRYLTFIENLREELLELLYEHNDNSNLHNYSKLELKKKAKAIRQKHIIKEYTHTDFDEYWGIIK